MGVSPEEGPGSAQAAKRPRPDAVTFNAAAAACAKAGDYQKAEQVLKQARRFNKLDAILETLNSGVSVDVVFEEYKWDFRYFVPVD